MCAAPLSLKGRALRLLSGREYSRAELERKLAPFEEAPGDLARTLDELQTKDFISEQRVVDSVLYRRAGKLGSARIQQELCAKGITPEAVKSAVATLNGTELERAREVWRKKYSAAPSDAPERARQMRFLASRGFSGEVVHRVVGNPTEDEF